MLRLSESIGFASVAEDLLSTPTRERVWRRCFLRAAVPLPAQEGQALQFRPWPEPSGLAAFG